MRGNKARHPTRRGETRQENSSGQHGPLGQSSGDYPKNDREPRNTALDLLSDETTMSLSNGNGAARVPPVSRLPAEPDVWAQPPSPISPYQHCWVRLRHLWWLKTAGLTAGLTLFFPAYFWVMRHPLHPVTVMPLTPVDHWIPFEPLALPVYLSLWFYLTLAPGLLTAPRELFSYAVAAGLLSLAGLGVFLIWPTAIPPAGIDWSHHPEFAFLKSADGPSNACPSLHVAFAVFTAIWNHRILRELRIGRALRAGNWLWCGGILYSTVAIRQHVALDVLAGFLLGAAVAAIHLAWLRRGAPADGNRISNPMSP